MHLMLMPPAGRRSGGWPDAVARFYLDPVGIWLGFSDDEMHVGSATRPISHFLILFIVTNMLAVIYASKCCLREMMTLVQ